MALTKVTGQVIEPTTNVQVGIITATKFVGPMEASGTSGFTNINVTGLSTFAGAIDANGDVDIDGHLDVDNVSVAGVTTFSAEVKIADQQFLNFGNGQLKLRTNSNSSYITEAGSGKLYIHTNELGLKNAGGTQNLAYFSEGAEVGLYFNNSLKFKTTNTGAVVTGILTVTGNMNVEGVLTYEDVTNIDSVGLITARSGVRVTGGGLNVVGVSTLQAVTGTTGTFSGAVSGTTGTFSGDVDIADKIVHTGDTNTAIRFPVNDNITFETSGDEAVRIDSGGRLILGHTASQEVYGTNKLQIQGTTAATSGLSLLRQGGSPYLVLGATNGSSLGAVTACGSGDRLGQLTFAGADGTDVNTHAASVAAYVDGSVSSNTVPGRLVFSTSTGAGEPERMRITSGGSLNIGGNFTQTSHQVSIVGGSSSQLKISGQEADIWLESTGGSTTTWRILGSTGGSTHQFRIFDGTGGADRLNIDSSGRVILGDTSVTNAHANADDLVIGNTSSGKRSGITIVSATDKDCQIHFSRGTSSGNANIKGQIVYSHATGNSSAETMRFYTDVSERMRIDGTGKVSIAPTAYGGGGTTPELYVRGTSGRQMKIHNTNASTSSLQITNATTGEGEDAGTQLFTQGSTGDFYIQSAFATADLIFGTKPSGGNTTERLRISSAGYVYPTPNGGGCIMGVWKYRQFNQSQNYEHVIRGPYGNSIATDMDGNSFFYIEVAVVGTGTGQAWCEYHVNWNSSEAGATLTHVRGNSGASSNRPYIVLNSNQPYWKMDHSGAYPMDIKVSMMGGKQDVTHTTHNTFNANP